MSVFLRVDINITAMILLSTVFAIAHNRLDKYEILNKKFLVTSALVLIEILFETLTCIINKRTEQILIPISTILHVYIFITAPMLTFLWYDFIRCWVRHDDKISYIKHIFLCMPIIINTVIAILSSFFGWIFYIDSTNSYHRGPLYFVSAAATYFYLICSFIYILKQRKNIILQELLPLIAFCFAPSIGGLIQSLFYGTLLMWSCAAYSLVIVYIFLQQRMVHLDSLSGAWTRESFEKYIMHRIKLKQKFGAIYIDLDGFKEINDEFGHLEGDFAIKTTVHIIKSVIRKSDFIARLGGDEFIIIFDVESKEKLDTIIKKIELKLNQYNHRSEKHYELKCSFGADIYNEDYTNIDQFIHHVDKLMYLNKRSKKLDHKINH